MATKKGVLKPSKITLPEVVKRALKRNANFFELDRFDQSKVFNYVVENHLDLRMFESKWYDILSNKFYALEYVASPDSYIGFEKEKKEFDSFKDFFQYIQGDIYDRCCFYGYEFSKEEIAEFSIDLCQINFDSLINETIDAYTFESVGEARNRRIDADRSTDLFKWLNDYGPVSTFDDLRIEYSRFIKEFDRFCDQYVFFSFYLRKYKKIAKEALIECACHDDFFSGISFDSILLTYGREAALYVIDNYCTFFSNSTRRARIKDFKDRLAGYGGGKLSMVRKAKYEEYEQLYHVVETYSNGVNMSLKKEEYFVDFTEFVAFLKGDLSDANLSKAPLTKEEVLKYKTNEYTKFPLSKQYKTYVLKKKYEKGEFIV